MTPSYPFSLTHVALFSKVMVMECTCSALSVEEGKEKREREGERDGERNGIIVKRMNEGGMEGVKVMRATN